MAMNICAPFAGIVHYRVEPGTRVDTGTTLASIEAVKLEAPLVAPGPGIIGRWLCDNYADVEGGQAVLTLEEG